MSITERFMDSRLTKTEPVITVKPPPARRRPRRGARWLTAAFALLFAAGAHAIPITIVDDAGPDDEPGQKDLNQLTVDFAPISGADLEVSWNWDVITVSGMNTGDACSLFDTDNDGNANYSLCVIWGNGATYQTMRLYECGDGAADRCTNPRPLLAEDMNGDGDLADTGEALVGGPYGSTCTLAVVADTFGARGGAQASAVSDTQASCKIELDDFGGMDAFLLNVCSYPSQVPGSDPSDCVITPNSGFLTIVKVADPDDGTTFTFNLGAGQAANNLDTAFSTDGSGSIDLIGFAVGTDYDLNEVVPNGWQLDTASCTLSNSNATGTPGATGVTDFQIQIGRETTCTFTNSELATLTLVKQVTNDNGGTETPAAWTLAADGTDDNDLTGAGGASGAVLADTFTLSETGPTGYTASTWSCDGGTLIGDELTLVAGDDVTCTITNDDSSPTLTVVKTVVNDNGGTSAPDDFNLTVDGTAVLSGTTNDFVAGNHSVAETLLAGYEASDWGGDCAADGSITLALDEDATCTITNDDISPTLTVVKTVVNDNGGTSAPNDFNLTVDGTAVLSGAMNAFVAGNHTVAETLLAGYEAGEWGGDCAADGSITLALDEDATCTITNNDISPTLTVVKTVVNDNGGTAGVSDFALFVDGGAVLSGATNAFVAGDHAVSENNVTGYSASVWGGNCAADGSITLALAQNAICTITNNDDAPSLTLIKDVINDNGGMAVPGDFTLTATGYDSGSPQAGTYDLSEIGPFGYTLKSLTCDNTVGQVTSVTLELGDDVTCTFVNDDVSPSLTLIKAVENGSNSGGTAVATDWTLTATGPTGFSGQTGVTSDPMFKAGEYDLSETGPAGYTASDWVCLGGSQSDGDTLSLGLGQSATCTITNTAMGMTTLLKLTNGVESSMAWNFTLTGPGVNESDSSPPTAVDFGGVKLIPGEEYALCENGIPAGWTLEWQVDTDGDGVPDTILPVVPGVNNAPVDPAFGYSGVYDPNYVAPPGSFTNDTRCVNFIVGDGETLAFQIDNQFPGGEPRTIGYWKNWNTCTGGNQTTTAANNGGSAAGWFILDDLLNNPGYTIGVLQLESTDCEDAVDILDKRSIDDGKKRASDAAYNLAAQLLAAQLNLSAGAETCQAVVDAVNAGQTLLANLTPSPFDGTGGYLKGKQGNVANGHATTLDEYNNGLLCN